MPLEILKSPAAEADLVDIWIYTEKKWGEAQADLYLDQIEEALGRVSDHPDSGSDCSDLRHGYRRIAVRSHRAYYRVHEGSIEVVRVLHSSMETRARLQD